MRGDELIAQNLDSSIKGLIELRKTYIDDPTVVAQIDVLMEEIKLKRGETDKFKTGGNGSGNNNNGGGNGKGSKKNM